MSVYEMHGRDEIFFKIGHDPDDELLWESVIKVADPNKVDDDGLTYLHVAAINYKVGAAEILLKMGANPNSFDKRGNTPLMYAVGRKNPSLVRMVQLLLDYGADLDLMCGAQTIRELIKTFRDTELLRFVE